MKLDELTTPASQMREMMDDVSDAAFRVGQQVKVRDTSGESVEGIIRSTEFLGAGDGVVDVELPDGRINVFDVAHIIDAGEEGEAERDPIDIANYGESVEDEDSKYIVRDKNRSGPGKGFDDEEKAEQYRSQQAASTGGAWEVTTQRDDGLYDDVNEQPHYTIEYTSVDDTFEGDSSDLDAVLAYALEMYKDHSVEVVEAGTDKVVFSA